MESIVDHQEFSITVFSHDTYSFNIGRYENDPDTMKYINEDLRYSDCKDYKDRKIQIAPVIRLFGTNNFGQKCAIHVHGYFPYFYVRIDDLVNVANETFLLQFAEQLERGYNLAYAPKGNPTNKNPKKNDQGKSKDFTTYQGYIVYSVELIEKFDVYTYHETREKFLKVKVYDSKYVKPICKLLTNGVFLDRPFQTYESHISYFMHFYSDCSIFGMSEMKVYKFKFRKNFEEMKMRAFQKIFVDKEYKNSFDIYIHPFDLVQLQFSNPELFSNLPKVSTCYIELDIFYEKIVNKVEYDLREYEPLFTQSQINKPGIGSFKQVEEFQVKITKALNALWKDEEDRRTDLGIKDPMTFFIDYKNNIEFALSKKNIDFEHATLDELKSYEPFMTNQMWDSVTKFKFQQHFENYCESLKRLREEPSDTPKKMFMDEKKAVNFFTVLQGEKNAMVTCINTRMAEWKRRFKENQMMKKIMANDLEEEDDVEDEDEHKTREDIRAIEGVNAMMAEKPPDTKKIKATKNYTYPAIAFCKKCMKDVSSCTCVFNNSQSSQKLIEKLFNHPANPAVVQTMASENSAKSAEDLDMITEDEEEEEEEALQEVDSFSGMVTFPNYYKAIKPAPSIKDILKSVHENCTEEIHQEPYFESAKELLEHYKYKPLVFEGANNSLILDKESKNSEAMNYQALQFFSRMLIQENKPPTIKNSLKIPDCVRFYTNYETKYREDQRRRHSHGHVYKYTKKAPSVSETLKTTDPKRRNKKSMLWRHDTKGSDFFAKISPFMKTPKTQTEKIDKKLRNKNVIADIVLFGFEVFARSRPNLLPNPDIDPITVLAFLITNEKENSKKIITNEEVILPLLSLLINLL